MKLFDSVISQINELTEEGKTSLVTSPSEWPTASERSMILRSDMAYELGGERLSAIGLTLVTEDASLVGEDSVTLLGPDISEINSDSPFARIALVLVDSETIGEGDKLYNAIKNLEYTRYHFFPKGFMMRISSFKNRECVRIGKAEKAGGLTFFKAGSLMIDAFKKNKSVKAVHLIYITAPDFNYKKLEELCAEADKITGTIDHIYKNVQMDCNVCNLQEICNEVEGLKELHFGR